MTFRNHRYKYKDEPLKRFFYRSILFTHIHYTYDFKYKYFHFVTSFLDSCLSIFLLLFRRPIIRFMNKLIYPLLRLSSNVISLIKLNKSSLLFIYLVNYTSNTSAVFYRSVFKFLLRLLQSFMSNVNYTYTSYGMFRQKFLLQILSEHHGYMPFLIGPMFYKRVFDVFNAWLLSMEKDVLNLDDVEAWVAKMKTHSNVAGLILNSLQRISPYKLFFFFFRKATTIFLVLSSFITTSFILLFYKLVLNNIIYFFTYLLDLFTILERIVFKGSFKFNKKKFNIKYALYPFSYVLSFVKKFVVSFSYKSMVDSMFRFIYFMIEHNGNLFYDRGSYWLNLKKLERFYRFQSSFSSKKDLADNFPGRNPEDLMEDGKAGPFNWNYDDIIEEDSDPFIYSDNHHDYKEAEGEDELSYFSYNYFMFNTVFMNNLLRVPLFFSALVITEIPIWRGIAISKYKQCVKWAGEFDQELMFRTKNPYLKDQFDTWEFWAPTNTVVWTMRSKVIVSFVIAIYFVENGFIYDGFFFPFNKELLMIRYITYSPLLVTGCWIFTLCTLCAYERLFGNPEDNVVGNYTGYLEDFEKKDEISMMDFKFSVFFNLVLSTYYLAYISSINSTLNFHRVEEIKRIRKVFQNRNTVCDNVSFSPLSQVSGDFIAEFVYTAKLSISRTLHYIIYFQ